MFIKKSCNIFLFLMFYYKTILNLLLYTHIHTQFIYVLTLILATEELNGRLTCDINKRKSGCFHGVIVA